MAKKYFAIFSIGLLSLVLCLSLATSTQAQSLIFDPEGTWGFTDWSTLVAAWGPDLGSPATTAWDNEVLSDALFSYDEDQPAPDGVAVQANGITVHNITFDSNAVLVKGPGAITLSGVTPTIKVTNSSAYDVISAVLAGAAGMVKTGDGELDLGAQNQYTGGTTVNGGKLVLSGGIDRLKNTEAITVLSGTLSLGGNVQNTSGVVSFQGGTVIAGGSIYETGANYDAKAGTVAASLNGTKGLDKTGAGTFVLSGANGYTGLTTISDNGILDLGGSTQTLPGGVKILGGTIQNGTINYNGTGVNYDGQAGTVEITGVLGGNAGLNKTGPGTLTLKAANTFTGAVVVSAGTLQSRLDTSLGAYPAGVTPAAVTLKGGATIEFISGYEWMGNRGLTITATEGNSFVTLNSSYGTGTQKFDAAITGSAGLIKTGVGQLGLTGVGSWNGNTRVMAGSISIRAANVLPYGTGKGDLYLDPASSGLNMNNQNSNINGLWGGSTTAVIYDWGAKNSRTLSVGYNDAISTFDGNFGVDYGNATSFSLNKVGLGTLTLTGNLGIGTTTAGTIIGPNFGLAALTVTAGTLKFANTAVVNAASLGIVNVMASANLDVSAFSNFTLGDATQTSTTAYAKKLMGNGTVIGNVRLVAGAANMVTTVAPGASAGILHVTGDMTFDNFSGLSIELGGITQGTLYDLLDVTGAIHLLSGSGLTATFINSYAPLGGESFDIMNFSSLSGAFDSGKITLPTLATGLTWDTSALYTTGVISVVPEPATFVLLVMAAAMMLFIRRKR